MIKNIALTRTMQRDLIVITLLATLLIIWLFNLFWAPLVFFAFTSYIILNKGKSLTKNERLGLCSVSVFLLYSVLARLFGMRPALLLIFVPVLIILLLYGFVWRKKT